jgi:conjugative relaxase-like TrwC/TraI family protein
MVASISARGSVEATVGYYEHLGRDDYYVRDGEPPGAWAGEGAARVALSGPVTRSDLEATLKGIDSRTGARLAALGGKLQNHTAGWDITFSAPKSVSVLWALSEPGERTGIERIHRDAVATVTAHLERTAAWARRGKAGAIRERTAGLVMVRFDHHASRDLDPQLHSHVLVLNLAPRKDGTWGAIVSRELYKAQKQAGAVYRAALAVKLERMGHAVERTRDSFRVAAIPLHVERAFSKRRQAIEAAAEAHGYRSAEGMELAALRTRRGKRDVRREALFEAWRTEAQALGFDLRRDRTLQSRDNMPNSGDKAQITRLPASPAAVSAATNNLGARLDRTAGKLASAAGVINQRAEMPGLAVDLDQRRNERDGR